MQELWTRYRSAFRRWLREPRIIWRSDPELMHITIEVQSWLLFVAFGIAFGWYIVAPSPIAMMTAFTLGGVLLSAFFWSRAMARGVRGWRRLRFAAMQVGDELEEQVGLRNSTPLLVIWAEFEDRSNIPGYTVSSARAADPLSQVAWRAQTICTRRGVFSLGPWEMRLGEPFGIFLTRQVYLQHQDILVYPPLAELPQHILPHRGAMGDHRPINQPLRAETISSTTVRGYVPGDPLRQIHWRTTARRDSPFVKVFAPEAASSVWLVPDFDATVHLGEGPDSSEEIMVTAAASLAAEMLQQNLSVGLLGSADTETVVLPRQGQAHLWEILQGLAPLRISPDRRLEDVIDRGRWLVSGNDLLIVITPSMRPDWIPVLRRISRSRGSFGGAEVVLLDPTSFGGVNEVEGQVTALIEQGIPAVPLRREDVRTISGYYGEISRWEFTVLGTGRVVARKTPRLAGQLRETGQPPLWKLPES